MPERRWLSSWSISLALSCLGLAGTLLSGGILFQTWFAQWSWLHSEERERLDRQLEAALPARRDDPSSATIGTTPTPASGPGRSPALVPRPVTGTAVPLFQSASAPAQVRPMAPASARARPSAPSPAPAQARQVIEIVETELRYHDPPGSGAHASITLTLKNPSNETSRPISIGVQADWFDHVAIIGAIPPVLDDRLHQDSYRYFDFPGVAPGADVVLELHVTAADGEVRPPLIRLALRNGESLGEVRPVVVAPPGPVRALSVPRLGIRTGVVETVWEPPAFVAGQIVTTAALGTGNSVVVGHRGGNAGDVFSRLLGARLGDEVVASSQGVEHRYVVSQVRVLPGGDSSPIGPSETPRLTLMTCVGAWNPLTGDYSHRLWVIAEPRDLARATLTATAARAGQAVVSPGAAEADVRARAEASLARAALAVMQANERRGRP